MMKKFLLIVCGSFVGVWLALTVFFFTALICSIAMIGLSSNGKGNNKVEDNSVLHLELSGEITERAIADDIDFVAMMQGNDVKSTGLNTMIAAIKEASTNDKITGIYIECNGVAAAPATLMALRNAITDFKKSGKYVYSYAHEGYSQGDYYVASVADSIFLNPVGAVDVHGLASATMYPKKLLDKIGVEMQVVRVGTFKSAVEPYMVEQMSDANRMQQEVYLGNIWKSMADSMAVSRNMKFDDFNCLADGVMVTMAADSLIKHNIVDKLCYRNEMEDRLKIVSGLNNDDDLRLVSPDALAGELDAEVSCENKIAVLYAVGEIDGATSMMRGNDGINSEVIVETVRDLIDDDDVKALVLRVNSPGGSAFGSEQMWKALDDFKKSGKTFVVSMGDYAASGGYYISCGADRIFAEPTTITGSIGIFGVIPCTQQLFEDKLGINTYVVKTNENADLGISSKRLSPVQQAAMQNMVNAGYDLFTKHCADGRHVTQDSIKVIAEGRVWDGVSAHKIGLVDELGGLDAAIKWAAKKAKIDKVDYKTQNYPTPSNRFQEILDEYMAQQYEAKMQGEMGFLYEYHKHLQRILNRDHVLCIMETSVIK